MYTDEPLDDLDRRTEKIERCIREAQSFAEFKGCYGSRYGVVERR